MIVIPHGGITANVIDAASLGTWIPLGPVVPKYPEASLSFGSSASLAPGEALGRLSDDQRLYLTSDDTGRLSWSLYGPGPFGCPEYLLTEAAARALSSARIVDDRTVALLSGEKVRLCAVHLPAGDGRSIHALALVRL